MLIKALWINWTFLNFMVTMGYDDLSANKFTQQYKTSRTCQSCVASKAVDRDIQTCTRMEDIGTTTNDRSTWWYVDLGGIYNLHNIRIQFKDYGGYTMRQRGRFAGFSLYVSNTTDMHSGYLCYKDRPVLPPLDFNTNCITHGRYIIFYNERLLWANYPIDYEVSPVLMELCEVIVTGCSSSGVYGENCDKVCPDTCQERRCDIINGTCLGCTPGWLGTHCDKACSVGYYGIQCESKCVGHCKDSVGCNHTSGLCDNGCDDGWTGSNCTKDDIESNALRESCIEASYIAGLSVLVIICIMLGSVCLFLMWKHYKLKKQMLSLQYVSVIRTSAQDNNSDKCQQYEELRI